MPCPDPVYKPDNTCGGRGCDADIGTPPNETFFGEFNRLNDAPPDDDTDFDIPILRLLSPADVNDATLEITKALMREFDIKEKVRHSRRAGGNSLPPSLSSSLPSTPSTQELVAKPYIPWWSWWGLVFNNVTEEWSDWKTVGGQYTHHARELSSLPAHIPTCTLCS